MIIAALAAVGFAIWLAGLLAGMAITRQPLEDLLNTWPDELSSCVEYDHPAFHLVKPRPQLFDWSREGNEGGG